MGRRIRRVGQAACATALISLMAALSFAVAQSAAPTISESGSTLMYPVFQAWIAAYKNVDHNLQIAAAATGSGAGVAEAIAKHVQIGTSDAYMSDDQAMANPHIPPRFANGTTGQSQN